MTIPVSHISTMTRWGGVEQMLVDLLTQGTPSHFRHTLLTTSSSPDVLASVVQSGATIFQPQRRFHYSPEAILQMAQWLKGQQIQVVHGYNTPASIWAGMAALMARTPVFICGEHGTVWRVSGPMVWLTRWAYQRAQCVIVNSEASKKFVHYRYGIPKDKIQVIYNVVPSFPSVDKAEIRGELGLTSSDIVIGSIGRIAPEKNYRAFVDVAAEIIKYRADVKFVLIGGGDLYAPLKNYVKMAGLESHLLLTGSRKDARRLLQAFDIFISTSVRETFGNVLIEAALAGIPTVAPCVDGIPEAVVDGVTGILLTPTEPVEEIFPGISSTTLPKQVLINGEFSKPLALHPGNLADTILYLIDNPDLRCQYGEAGRKRAIEAFSLERYQLELEQIYHTALTNYRIGHKHTN